MKRKVFHYKVVPLGVDFRNIERNIHWQKEQGWSLISTYMGINQNTVTKEPSLCGVFETWTKEKV
jgi:hypothetical protein